MSDVAEILIARAWNNLQFQQPLTTNCQRTVRVIYPGVWSHGIGPDFRNAMLDIDDRLVIGDVEVEVRAQGWFDHNHHQNSAFDDVVLQVVIEDDLDQPARRSNGGTVPRVDLTDYLHRPVDLSSPGPDIRPLGAIGFETCAPHVAEVQPELIRDIWQRAGDQRMQHKVSSISGELAVHAPSQVLYGGILDALGYSRNREPMAEIAARLPIDQLASVLAGQSGSDRVWNAAALLLGIGGFLPLSPRDAGTGRIEPSRTGSIERAWRDLGHPWHGIEVSPGFWTLTRIRPAAHPVRRLLAGAVILSASGGEIVQQLVHSLTGPQPRRALMAWLAGDNPWLGRDHAHELIVNVMLPFALAYGQEARQPDLVDAAADLWESLPAGRGNSVTRTTREQICGDVSLPPKSARAEQGLIHLNRMGCSQMRCFECPIAHLAVEFDAESASATSIL
jgi:hypothetical protein